MVSAVKTNVEPVTEEPASLPTGNSPPPSSDKDELVRILVIGSPGGVGSIIRTLYLLGFARVDEWSRLLPAPNSHNVMSILTRRLRRSRD
ncbi:MAG: peptide ABC transporter substrate-binding protein [Cyanobacteriota bacterium]|nr:peptide ABC transporter substrate-binding protein [Cyanobacteriota bacterium]